MIKNIKIKNILYIIKISKSTTIDKFINLKHNEISRLTISYH
jgi:hypothetical protein